MMHQGNNVGFALWITLYLRFLKVTLCFWLFSPFIMCSCALYFWSLFLAQPIFMGLISGITL